MDYQLLAIILGSGVVGGATVKLIESVVMFRLNRKAAKEDNEAKTEKEEETEMAEWQKAMTAKVDAVVMSEKFLLLDKIQHLALKYIEAKEITFEQRRQLNEAHKVYHNGLGGNGDLDGPMKQVNALPLKRRE